MNRPSILRLLAVTAALTPSAFAQVTYDSDLGTAVTFVPTGAFAATDEGKATVGPLGHAFTFPDGATSVSSFDILTNGRIVPVGADPADFDETVAEFLGDTTAVCPFWEDMQLDAGSVFFSTNSSRTTVTFVDARRFGQFTLFTFQLQLHADGRIGFVYDSRIPSSTPIWGLSDGSGSNPGESDLSSSPSSGTDATIYEVHGPGDLFDLADQAIEFTPNITSIPGFPGGWTTAVGPAGFPLPPIAGFAVEIGKSINRTLEFFPNGAGGYTVSKTIPTWFDDTGIGTDLGLFNDTISPPLALGFPFEMPGGGIVTSVFVGENGRVLASTPNPSFSFFEPHPTTLLGGFPASLCPFWCNLEPGFSVLPGTVTFYADPAGGFATVTWREMNQTFSGNSVTFQVVMYPDHSFCFNYLDTTDYVPILALVGCSSGVDGSGSDPGEVNFADSPNFSNSEGTVYEFWTFLDHADIQPNLSIVGTPEMGGTVEVRVEGVSSGATMPTLLLGFFNTVPPNLTLDYLGIEGGVLSTSGEICIPLTVVDNAASFSVPLEVIPALVGILDAYFQVVYLDASDTTLGVGLSNGLNVFW